MKEGTTRPPPEPAVKVVTFMATKTTKEFPKRLAALRKGKGFTQQELADRAGISVIQIHRYEAGTSQPSLDAICRLSQTLGVSSDEVIFGKHGRDPDEDLRLQFEAIGRFDAEEKRIAKALLDSLILKYEAKRWATAR